MDFLLKESKRIFTIGFGVPGIFGPSPVFKEKKKANFLFLSMEI